MTRRSKYLILPGTGRWQREALTEGVRLLTRPHPETRATTTTFGGGSPSRAGEDSLPC
jgi:hypothetical protein